MLVQTGRVHPKSSLPPITRPADRAYALSTQGLRPFADIYGLWKLGSQSESASDRHRHADREYSAIAARWLGFWDWRMEDGGWRIDMD